MSELNHPPPVPESEPTGPGAVQTESKGRSGAAKRVFGQATPRVLTAVWQMLAQQRASAAAARAHGGDGPGSHAGAAWDYSAYDQPTAYGDDTTYSKGMAFLDGHGTIEDWGCGTAYA